MTGLYYGSWLAVLALAGLGLTTKPQLVWFAVAGSCVLSFLGAFSIGLFTLVVTFAMLAVAVGRAFGLVQGAGRTALAAAVGVAAWAVAIRVIDDAWLFLPFSLVSAWASR